MTGFDEAKMEKFKNKLLDEMLEVVEREVKQNNSSLEIKAAACDALSQVLAFMAAGMLATKDKTNVPPFEVIQAAGNNAMHSIFNTFEMAARQN